MTQAPLIEAHRVTLGAWTALVRRSRIGQERKLAALLVASYADADGGSIHCGVARLALDLERSVATARRHLAWLRETGLIRLVRPGNSRRGLSDEYELILAENVLERLEVPNPSEYEAQRAELAAVARRKRPPVDSGAQLCITLPDQRSPWMSGNDSPREAITAHPG